MSRKSAVFKGMTVLTLSLVVVALALSLAAGCGEPAEEKLTINEIKLSEEDLPGWTLMDELKATPQNAAEGSIVPQLYDEGAEAILNQVFEKSGARLQVNYVQMEDTDAGRRAEAMLEAAVGGTNYIGHKQNIAIEIIGDTPDISTAAEALGLSL